MRRASRHFQHVERDDSIKVIRRRAALCNRAISHVSVFMFGLRHEISRGRQCIKCLSSDKELDDAPSLCTIPTYIASERKISYILI